MEFSTRPRSGDYRRYSLDSDFGLSSSTSTIDPNDTAYSDCPSSIFLNSTLGDDTFSQSLGIGPESIECLHNTVFDSSPEEVLSYNNASALCQDMRLVNGDSDWCDICFLVGDEKIPVYGVRSIICARSRVLCSTILTQERKSRTTGRKSKKLVTIARVVKRFLGIRKNRRSGSDRTKQKENIRTIEIPEFPVDVFRQIVHFLHSGTIDIQLSNVVDVLAAADVYGLEELRSVCDDFARGFITKQTVLPLLDSTLPHKAPSACMQLLEQVLHFIDQSSDEILQLPGFLALSRETAILILSRGSLRVSEEAKWDAALRWCREHCDGDVRLLRVYLKSFTPNIDLLQVPLAKLLSEVTSLCDKKHETADRVPETADWYYPESLMWKCSVSSASSKFSLASDGTESGYASSFRESCLL